MTSHSNEVYMVWWDEDPRVYIGRSTVSAEVRFASHLRRMKDGIRNKYMADLYKKYGRPKWKVLLTVDTPGLANFMEGWFMHYLPDNMLLNEEGTGNWRYVGAVLPGEEEEEREWTQLDFLPAPS